MYNSFIENRLDNGRNNTWNAWIWMIIIVEKYSNRASSNRSQPMKTEMRWYTCYRRIYATDASGFKFSCAETDCRYHSITKVARTARLRDEYASGTLRLYVTRRSPCHTGSWHAKLIGRGRQPIGSRFVQSMKRPIQSLRFEILEIYNRYVESFV